MEPFQTCDATLPQQDLTQPAGGCPSGLRPGDLLQGGHEGADPRVGQQKANEVVDSATTGTLQPPGVAASTLGDAPGEAGTSNTKIMTRLDIYKLFAGKSLPLSERVDILISTIGKELILSRSREEIIATLPSVLTKCENMYRKCKYNINYFIKKHKDWIGETFISGHLPPSLETASKDFSLSASPKTKQFLNLSARQQIRSRKRLETILENEPQAKRIKAFVNTLHIEGEPIPSKNAKEVEFVINSCLESKSASKNITQKLSTAPRPYNTEEALAIIIDKKMTVDTYNFLHMDLHTRGCPMFPPYHKVLDEKQKCYPESVQVLEREAAVPLQCLLQHTFQRIVQMQSDVFQQYCNNNDLNDLECLFEASWGFDGSSGQALYKQNFSDGGSDESSLFATTLVPLRIRMNSTILWINPAPQSYRYCRPLRIVQEKESKTLILAEKQRVEDEISNLTPLESKISTGQTIKAACDLYLAAVDGKVLNVILNTPSQMRCPYCGLTANKFNDLNAAFSKAVNIQDFKHGISPLHAWIRVLEFLLKLGYKNGIKKWRIAQNSEEGRLVNDRKTKIIEEIRKKIGVLVDVVRPNSGTTNDGNTARTVQSDAHRETFSEIIGIDKWLLDDLHIILIVLSSGLPINSEMFSSFCKDIAYKYVSSFNWHPMTVTIHKILVHGGAIIQHTSVPIGMLSEQAAESRNKYLRHDREHHTRKSNRTKTMFDLFHRTFVSSDPIISAHRLDQRQKKLKKCPLPARAIALLKLMSADELTVTVSDESSSTKSYYENTDELQNHSEFLTVETEL